MQYINKLNYYPSLKKTCYAVNPDMHLSHIKFYSRFNDFIDKKLNSILVGAGKWVVGLTVVCFLSRYIKEVCTQKIVYKNQFVILKRAIAI